MWGGQETERHRWGQKRYGDKHKHRHINRDGLAFENWILEILRTWLFRYIMRLIWKKKLNKRQYEFGAMPVHQNSKLTSLTLVCIFVLFMWCVFVLGICVTQYVFRSQRTTLSAVSFLLTYLMKEPFVVHHCISSGLDNRCLEVLILLSLICHLKHWYTDVYHCTHLFMSELISSLYGKYPISWTITSNKLQEL